jgi:hypothetical protein
MIILEILGGLAVAALIGLGCVEVIKFIEKRGKQ